MKLLEISESLAENVDSMQFGEPVAYTYNPFQYARKSLNTYLARYGGGRKEVLLLGMNPGPFGMAQTGIPFGDVAMVRDWLGIEETVGRPEKEHPKRRVTGFACPRGEVSGSRLWGWAKTRYATPERFFKKFFVWNYCPLVFMDEGGRNVTPDKLRKNETEELFAHCDDALRNLCSYLQPELVVGVGKFAEKQAARALADSDISTGSILHPSPASPAANRGWAEQAEQGFAKLGVTL